MPGITMQVRANCLTNSSADDRGLFRRAPDVAAGRTTVEDSFVIGSGDL